MRAVRPQMKMLATTTAMQLQQGKTSGCWRRCTAPAIIDSATILSSIAGTVGYCRCRRWTPNHSEVRLKGAIWANERTQRFIQGSFFFFLCIGVGGLESLGPTAIPVSNKKLPVEQRYHCNGRTAGQDFCSGDIQYQQDRQKLHSLDIAAWSNFTFIISSVNDKILSIGCPTLHCWCLIGHYWKNVCT